MDSSIRLFYDGINPDGPGINLRWQSPDSKEGVHDLDLRVGVVFRVHIVQRTVPVEWFRSTFDGSAVIMNQDYLVSAEIKWTRPPGSETRIRLEIRSLDKRWSSGNVFLLEVPPEGDSNHSLRLRIVNT